MHLTRLVCSILKLSYRSTHSQCHRSTVVLLTCVREMPHPFHIAS